MLTFFARHTRDLDVDDETRKRLFDERRVGVHFPGEKIDGFFPEHDSRSINPGDYQGAGKRAMSALCKLARDGGYVYAEYYKVPQTLIGKVMPNTPVELFEGRWGKNNGREGKVAVLKTVRLGNARTLDPGQIVALTVSRPRQGTMMRWPSAGKTVELLIEGGRPAVTPASLAPSQMEVLCSEFLRAQHLHRPDLPRLAQLILPVGRTLRHIDIYALADDGKQLLAQVTFAKETQRQDKVEQLRVHADRANHLVYFCNDPVGNAQDGVLRVSLDEVFEYFKAKPLFQTWFDLATGR